MKFVLACYGTRGDAEPGAAIGRELLRRGHDVCMVVAPDLVSFAESAGLAAVAYGPDSQTWLDVHRDFVTRLFRSPWKIRDLIALGRKDLELLSQCGNEASTTLKALAESADLLLTGPHAEDCAANVAEYYGIPLATLHFSPLRANGQGTPILPAVGRFAGTAYDWLIWRVTKKREERQRNELGLPLAKRPSPWRITQRGSLEIQAYDEVWFPGLAAEWTKFDGRRPFVGTPTLELSTEVDDEVASWIAAGTPPIFFGFGSIPVEGSADSALAMISDACAQLGERALVCSAATDFTHAARWDHVKVVDAVNYAAVFPACRAVVHHGGLGTTTAGVRAGVPTLMLWTWGDSAIRGRRLEQLKVGVARPFSSTTKETLVADLRAILAPQYLARARQLATQMTKSAESAMAAADLLENFARLGGHAFNIPPKRESGNASSARHPHAD
jgi:UDP:flavonoid glycosyltransferase YjiC (YdhE family)